MTTTEARIAKSMCDLKDEALKHLHKVAGDLLGEYLAIWKRRQHDYSWMNIGMIGPEGVFGRMVDKFMRLHNYYWRGRKMQSEKLEDAWLDMLGYAMIGLLLERGEWPRITLEEIVAAMSVTGDSVYEVVGAEERLYAAIYGEDDVIEELADESLPDEWLHEEHQDVVDVDSDSLDELTGPELRQAAMAAARVFASILHHGWDQTDLDWDFPEGWIICLLELMEEKRNATHMLSHLHNSLTKRLEHGRW